MIIPRFHTFSPLNIFEKGDFSLKKSLLHSIRIPNLEVQRLFHENVDEMLVDRNLCGTGSKMVDVHCPKISLQYEHEMKMMSKRRMLGYAILIYFEQTRVSPSPLQCVAEQLCRLCLCSNQTPLAATPIDTHLII